MACKKVMISLPQDVFNDLDSVDFRSTYLAHLVKAQRVRILGAFETLQKYGIRIEEAKNLVESLNDGGFTRCAKSSLRFVLNKTNGNVLKNKSEYDISEVIDAIYTLLEDVRYGRNLYFYERSCSSRMNSIMATSKK